MPLSPRRGATSYWLGMSFRICWNFYGPLQTINYSDWIRRIGEAAPPGAYQQRAIFALTFGSTNGVEGMRSRAIWGLVISAEILTVLYGMLCVYLCVVYGKRNMIDCTWLWQSLRCDAKFDTVSGKLMRYGPKHVNFWLSRIDQSSLWQLQRICNV